MNRIFVSLILRWGVLASVAPRSAAATTEDGAYINVGNQATFARQPGARFSIPTENEWYEAAYHDGSAGVAAVYFDYAAGSSALPGNDVSESTNPGNNANVRADGDYAIGPPYFRALVGEFEVSDSPYGTFDQGGNVREWNETVVTPSARGVRGSSFNSGSLNPEIRYAFNPTDQDYFVGFRVATIPEPGSLLLAIMGSSACAINAALGSQRARLIDSRSQLTSRAPELSG